jgi:predicted transcriptional regulator/PAS domain-containing protein
VCFLSFTRILNLHNCGVLGELEDNEINNNSYIKWIDNLSPLLSNKLSIRTIRFDKLKSLVDSNLNLVKTMNFDFIFFELESFFKNNSLSDFDNYICETITKISLPIIYLYENDLLINDIFQDYANFSKINKYFLKYPISNNFLIDSIKKLGGGDLKMNDDYNMCLSTDVDSNLKLDDSKTTTHSNDLLKNNTFNSEIDILEKSIPINVIHNILNYSNDSIIYVLNDGTISLCNKSMYKQIDVSCSDIINKNIHDDEFPKSFEPFLKLIKKSFSNFQSFLEEHEILDSDGNKKQLISHTYLIKDLNLNLNGIILISKQTSERYSIVKKISVGNSYLNIDSNSNNLIDLFNSYSDLNYSLLCITRSSIDVLKNKLDFKTNYIKMPSFDLTDNISKTNSVNTDILEKIKLEYFNNLKNKIFSHLNNNSETVVLFNNLEYLLIILGFDKLMQLLYMINDRTRITKNIMFVNAVKDCFSETQIAFLKEEFNPLPKIEQDSLMLDKKKMDILKFILNKSSFHFNVQYSLISNEFNLSRMTTKKWIDELQNKSLLITKKNGRAKYIYITEKGKKLITNN